MNYLQLALSEYGVKEIAGKQDNPQVLKYFDQTGFDGSALKDETSWCSAFVNWVCQCSCLQYSGKLNARSWLSVGKEMKVPDITKPTIVVFWRGSHENETIKGSDLKKGHVGFFMRETKNWVYVLGGNQSNQVKISAYPKSKVLKYIDVS